MESKQYLDYAGLQHLVGYLKTEDNFSGTSTNPVENQLITNTFNGVFNKLIDLFKEYTDKADTGDLQILALIDVLVAIFNKLIELFQEYIDQDGIIGGNGGENVSDSVLVNIFNQLIALFREYIDKDIISGENGNEENSVLITIFKQLIELIQEYIDKDIVDMKNNTINASIEVFEQDVISDTVIITFEKSKRNNNYITYIEAITTDGNIQIGGKYFIQKELDTLTITHIDIMNITKLRVYISGGE